MSAIPLPARKPHWLWYDGGGVDVILESVKKDASKAFPSNRQKWHAAVVVTAGAISFSLVDVHYESIFEVLWDAAVAPYLSEQVG